jgi:hypothetical protein
MPSLYDDSAYLRVEPFKANILLAYIESAVNRAIIQFDRISRHRQKGKQLGRFSENRDQYRLFWLMLQSDIHYYLIYWADVNRLYEKLIEIQPIFQDIDEKYNGYLKEHRNLRNKLEHFGDKLDKAFHKKGITHLGSLIGDRISFFDKQIEISESDVQKLRNFYESLCTIARKPKKSS